MDFTFDTRDQASAAAADRIADLLQQRLRAQGTTSLVVSGGTTPAKCFEELSNRRLEWSRVDILASDERWVAADHEDSNERLIRNTLLVNNAAEANLLGYFDNSVSVEQRCDDLEQAIHSASSSFACAMLGMGADGHFASLFPDADALEEGLDPDSDRLFLPVQTAASPYARISLTLAALLSSDEIVLLFFGHDKRVVFEKAAAGNARYPITRLLRQQRTPVNTYWAP